MPSVFIFYSVLAILTLYLVMKATSLKGKDLGKTTVYELTDRASWIFGGLLLAILPLWWKWPLQSILGAILIPLLGVIITGGAIQLTLGEILQTKSTPKLIRKLVSIAIFYVIVFFVTRFILNLIF